MNGAIVLIGPMGSGKSEVGARLAEKTGRPFVDTDKLVEEISGRSIEDIFEEEGEKAFRKFESEAVLIALTEPDAVISCGGGTVLDPVNAQALRRAGKVVYLKIEPKQATARVHDELDSRPLLTDDDIESLLIDLLREREPVYRRVADHIVDASPPADEVVVAVMQVLGL